MRGVLPSYYDLWAASAGKNPEFDFLIFSDLPFPQNEYPNIKIIRATFREIKILVEKKLKMRVALENPYKLCDYKPAYGYIFEEYLKEYDFWGFCDMDLIFGNISSFIDDELLSKYDKILFQGHFSLNRNNDRMNSMFLHTFPNIINYKIAFFTHHICHFDENGTLAYCNEYDSDVRFFFKWIFYDTDFLSYELKLHGSEAMLMWDNGKLTAYWNEGKNSEEMMYVHLQKRTMHREFNGIPKKVAIMRDTFMCADCKLPAELLQIPIDLARQSEFNKRIAERMKTIKHEKIKNGWIKVKLYSMIHQCRSQKNLSCT